jgi:hypothetical protein
MENLWCVRFKSYVVSKGFAPIILLIIARLIVCMYIFVCVHMSILIFLISSQKSLKLVV